MTTAHTTKAALFAAAALLTAGAANAQVMTQTTETVTTEVQTDVYPPNAVDSQFAPSFPGQAVTTTETTRTLTEQVSVPHEGQLAGGSTVQVKIPSGQVLTINDAPGAPWAKDPQLAGYDRFTFDPVANVLVAGKGEAKFESNWDENGNRIQKAKAEPKPAAKKKVVKAAEEAPAEPEAPAEVPAAEPVAEPVAEEPVAPTPVSGSAM